ncbi:MAG: hypothetical protein IPJ94_31435 [Chloroflexi bacterium]|nr:hypothetical protein [Chloroflexota bacterium]
MVGRLITPDDVIEALRVWHGNDTQNWPLAHLRIGLEATRNEDAFSSLAEGGPAAQNRAVLSWGLAALRMVMPEAEDLLRERFEHRRDVLAVANRLNVSESSIYYRQRQAINQLTDILNTLEESSGISWRQRMINRLEFPSYSQLVGVQDARETLIEALSPDSGHFIISIDGLGGMGKTALADQLARDMIESMEFDDIAWTTAKQTHLSSLGRLKVESGRPSLTFPLLLDKLADQFEIPLNTYSSQLQRQKLTRQHLQERTCLVVVDNLETVADDRSLLPSLRKVQNPSKFLLTSRFRLLDEPDVFSFSQKELSAEAAYELIRLEAKRTGFASLAQTTETELQPIYEAVGGNPLALKLIVGQLKFRSLPRVLNRFDLGGGNQNRDELFEYIYREIWETLHNDSKMTLLALTQAGASGFTFDHLVAVSGLAEEAVDASLEKLILLSLVDIGGNLLERRYRLHRLTEVFLLKMFDDA